MLTTKELQETLKIGRDRAYALMRSKAVPSIKIGARYYVTQEALDEWLRTYAYRTFHL